MFVMFCVEGVRRGLIHHMFIEFELAGCFSAHLLLSCWFLRHAAGSERHPAGESHVDKRLKNPEKLRFGCHRNVDCHHSSDSENVHFSDRPGSLLPPEAACGITTGTSYNPFKDQDWCWGGVAALQLVPGFYFYAPSCPGACGPSPTLSTPHLEVGVAL